MDRVTRRTFFKQAGATAAAAGVATAVPGGLAGASAMPTRALTTEEAHSSRPLVAHVTDPHAGRISVFVGDREIRIRDREIVARLVRAAR